MNIDKFITVSDLFTYYVAGLVWLANLLLSYALGRDLLSLVLIVNQLPAVLTFALLFVPYILGFALTPLAEWVRKQIEGPGRRRHPDPKKWLIQSQRPFKNDLLEGQRLDKKEAVAIFNKAAQVLGYSYGADKERLYFSPIRSYVAQRGGGASILADRARNLMSLCESILVPLPVLIVLIALNLSQSNFITIVLSAILACWIFTQILERYYRFEIYWTRHVYRALLVMEE